MVMGPDFSARNIFSSTLEDTDLGRQALLQSFLPEAQGFNQRNFFRNLYKPVFTDYLGAYGRAGRMGETPPTFQQYISGLDFQELHLVVDSFLEGKSDISKLSTRRRVSK